MIVGLKVIFLVIAVILFLFAAFFNWFVAPENRVSRFNLMSAGLFFFAARELLT